MASMQCVVVTPEKTELSVEADSIVVPLFDGQLGILKGRSPMIGRLGFGLMKVRSGSNESSYFVDGGFVQVTREGVYVLTDRLLNPDSIDGNKALDDLAKALSMPATSPELMAARDRAVAQARAKSRFVK